MENYGTLTGLSKPAESHVVRGIAEAINKMSFCDFNELKKMVKEWGLDLVKKD